MVDREGVVMAVEAAGEEESRQPLPLIRWSTAAPKPGQRIDSVALARGLRLLDDLQTLRLASGGRIEIDIDDPFALVVTLPAKKRRVIFPPGDLPGALATYFRIASSLRDNPGGRLQTIDVRTATGPQPRWVILQQ
jgi:cell division septal protein FtsQ